MLPAVFQALKASSDVRAIVGTNPPRIYRHGRAPQRPDGLPLDQPYITWQLINGLPENNLSDPPPVDRSTVQINCWYPKIGGDVGVVTLAKAARLAIESVATITSIPVDQQEPTTELFWIALQVDFFTGRSS